MTKPDDFQQALSRRIDEILTRPSTLREIFLRYYYAIEQIAPWSSVVAFQSIILFKSNFSILSITLVLMALAITVTTFAVGFFLYDKNNLASCVSRLRSLPKGTTLSPVREDGFTASQNAVSRFIDQNFRRRPGSNDSPGPMILRLNGPPRLFFRAFQFFPNTHPCVIFLSGNISRMGGPQKFFLWHEIAHSHDFMILEDSLESMLVALQISLTATILVQQPVSLDGLVVATSASLLIIVTFLLFRKRRRHALLKEEIFADSLAVGMLDDNDMKQCVMFFKRSDLTDNNLPGHYSRMRNEALHKSLNRWAEIFNLSDRNPQPAYFGVLLSEYLKSNRFKPDVWLLPASAVLCGLLSGPASFSAFVLFSGLLVASVILTIRLYSEHQALVECLKLELRERLESQLGAEE